LDKETGLTELRLNTFLIPEDKKAEGQYESSEFIEDITSSEIMLVDDLSKVHEILKEVKKIDPLRHAAAAGNWDSFE
jgi:hypothetical protein